MAAFTNRATLSYNGVTAVSNVVTGEIVGALTATKTALTEEYSAGDTLTYVITLVNSGETDITGFTVNDDLGAYTFNALTLVPLTYVEDSAKLFVNGVPQPVTAAAGDGLIFSGVTVPAGGSAVIVYSAQLNEYAPLQAGGAIKNTVSVTSAKIDPSVTAEETVAASGEAELDINKSLCPASVTENGALTYTFVISNRGPAEADASYNVVLSDAFDPVLTDITVTLDGAPLAEDTGYTYDEASGVFATVPGVITVPAATYAQDPVTGEWTTTPGTATLTVSGTV